MDHWYVKLFLAVGGAALIWKLAKGQAKNAAKDAAKKLMIKFPSFRAFMIAHKVDIDEIVDSVQAGVDEAVDEEAATDAPKAP